MITSWWGSRSLSRLFITTALVCCAGSSIALQTNPFPTSTPERLKKTASAYRARAELVPPELRPPYLAWADYYDNLAGLEPGGPVSDPPRISPGATAPSAGLAEGASGSKKGIGSLEALSIAVDVASNPGSAAQGALDAFMAREDDVLARFEARYQDWKRLQAEVRGHRVEIATWCASHADHAARGYIEAARNGDLETVKRWIEDGNDPNACDETGETALTAAARPSGRTPASQQTNLPPVSDASAASTRSEDGNPDLPIEKLVEAARQGDKDARDQLERICMRPINTAEDVARVEDIFIANSELNTTMKISEIKRIAALTRDLTNVLKERSKMLAEHPLPSLPSHVLVTRYLLQHGADLVARTATLNTPLDTADRWSARLLIDAGAPVDASGSEYSALKLAVIGGNTQHILLLIASGAHPSLSDAYVTDDIQARASGYWDLARLLEHFKRKDAAVAEALHRIARPVTGAIPLNFAASDGNTELVQRCLESGVNVDAVDDCSWTPLMNAAQADNVDVMKLLLDKGASVNSTNMFGQTALILAIRAASMKAASLLLERGADPRIKDISKMGAREWLNARTRPFGIRIFSAEEANALAEQLKQAEAAKKRR